jgi:SAM-dependent methyltransferase
MNVLRKFRSLTQGRLSCFNQVLPSLAGKRGLEIGGPSTVFRDWFRPFPIYKYVAELDNSVFSRSTVWADHSDEFNFYPGKTGKNIFGDGSFLSSISDESYDFVLSSHNLEHFANPIRALKEWGRVLKHGGLMVVVLPHYAKCFDYRRKPAPLQHMIDDYVRNVGEDDLSHVEESYAAYLLEHPKASPEELAAFRGLLETNFTHRMMHHHCFDEFNSRELLQEVGLKIDSVEVKSPFHIFLVAHKPNS